MSVNLGVKDNIDILDIDCEVSDKNFFITFDSAVATLKKSDRPGVVVTGKKFPRDFALSEILTADAEFLALSKKWAQALRGLEMLGKPVIAALQGDALGSGLEILLSCQHRVGITGQVGFPQVNLGLFPAHGGTQRLARLLGLEKALTILTTGRTLSFAQSQLFTELVADEDAMWQACLRLIEESQSDPRQPWERSDFCWPHAKPGSIEMNKIWMITPAAIFKKTSGHYPVFSTIASCLHEGSMLHIDSAINNDQEWWQRLLSLPATKNIVKVLGVEKGKLAAQARAQKTARPMQTIGVIGAGMMGAGIATVSALAGFKVVVKDTSLTKADAALDRARAYLERKQLPSTDTLARITTTDEPAVLQNCDLVIEAIFENRDLKKTVIAEVEPFLHPEAVFASNTSTLPITSLATYATRPASFIGLHFFSPVEKMQLVEIIKGNKTSQDAIDFCFAYVSRLRKIPILVNDARSFYTSRVFMTYLIEGLTLVYEGQDPVLVEKAGRRAGMPVAPLALIDEISLELVQQIFTQTVKDGDEVSPAAQAVIVKMLAEHERAGKKTSKGFYDYSHHKKMLWPGVRELFPRQKQLSLNEMSRRLLAVQTAEATRCLQEGIIRSAEDANVGSVLGWGFPAFLGGVLGSRQEVI